ncbi:MAG: acyl-CoA dehydrogenase family protein [Candidatus Heimdallarchaeota archaeon]|nr:acyl-CoA dehydrogenase family protein [Candidatus Heimdallarchaeota archaeon]
MKQLTKIFKTLNFDKETQEQNEMILDMVYELAMNEIIEKEQDWDEEGAHFDPETKKVSYPSGMMDLYKKCQQNDLFSIIVPEKYDGFGLSYTLWNAVIELMARASLSFSMFFPSQGLNIEIINKFGTPEAKEKYLPLLASGDVIGAMAFSEPNAGSDISAVATKAEKEGDSYYLTGNKIWLSHGGTAGTYITFAVTDKSAGHRGLSAFVIDPKIAKENLELVRIEEKMGLHGSITAQMALDRAEVPKENLLGKENDGLRLILGSLASSRIGIAAQSVGISETALQESINYSMQRSQFGKPIGKHQAISFMLADMATRVHQARVLYLNTAQMKHIGENTQVESSMAKYWATELAQKVTYDAVQIHGGYGYSREYRVERLFRDARVLTIFEGTSEMQKTIISRGTLARAQK